MELALITSCWSCTHPLEGEYAICPHCSMIQPPANIDHFKRFGLAPAFEIDVSALEKSYILMQQQLHPDRFTGKQERERTLSLQQTMALNESYEILKSPLKRAEYLLSLKGFKVNVDGAGIKPNATLLMDMMEHREILEEITTPEEIDEFERKIKQERTECIARISECFQFNTLEEAAQQTIRLQYLGKTLQEVKQKKGKG